MKMLKKVVSVLLVATMAVSMLTACNKKVSSENISGEDAVVGEVVGASGKLADFINTDKLMLNLESLDGSISLTEAVNKVPGARKAYLKTVSDDEGGKQIAEVWVYENESYTLASVQDKSSGVPTVVMAWKTADKIESNLPGTLSKDAELSNVRVVNNYKVNGTVYYTEMIELDDTKTYFCFDGDRLVYIAGETKKGEKETYKVNGITSSFDESIFELPSDIEFRDAPSIGF